MRRAAAPPSAALPHRLRPGWLPHLLIAALLCAAAVAVYWGALRHPLVFDDRVLREDLLRHYASSGIRLDLRWLSYASFGLIYQLLGNDLFWQRLANVLLHAATATMLFVFLARLFDAVLPRRDAAGTPDTRWLAALGAALFLLHPVAAYGVAYLVQRSIVMATLFSVVSLCCFLEGLLRRSLVWQLVAVAAYFAAVYSKEHAIMAPAVALALAVLVRGSLLRALREQWLVWVLFAAVAVAVVLKARGVLGAPYEPLVQSVLAQVEESRAGSEATATYPLSIVNQAFLYFRYLLTWGVPHTGWMSIDLRVPFPAHPFAWPHVAGLAAYAVYPFAAFALILRGCRAGLAGFALLAPWLLALTEISTVRVQEPFVLYRSYLWMAVPVAMLPVLLGGLLRRWTLPVFACACLVLVPLLLNRLDTFTGAVPLWSDAIEKQRATDAPYVERAWHNRGFAHLQGGRHAEALRDFNRALDLNPRDANALLGRGTLSGRTGNYVAALADLDRAIEVDPRYPEAYAKRCFTRMMLGEPRLALAECEKAVALDPRHRDAHTNLGVVYAALGRPRDAEASYRRALALDSGNGDASYNYGVLLAVTGRIPEARGQLRAACKARVAAACNMLPGLGTGR